MDVVEFIEERNRMCNYYGAAMHSLSARSARRCKGSASPSDR